MLKVDYNFGDGGKETRPASNIIATHPYILGRNYAVKANVYVEFTPDLPSGYDFGFPDKSTPHTDPSQVELKVVQCEPAVIPLAQ